MIVEHRKYMRVDDRLVISWRPADSEELVVDDLRDVMLMTVNREINDMISGLAQGSPEVAQVLMHLNHKLDLMGEQARESHYGPGLVRLNLSRSGVAFEWKSDIKVGSNIRLYLTLPPDNEKLSILAEVLACDPMDGNRSRIRCQFLPSQDARVERLTDYIDHLQEMRLNRNQLRAPLPPKPTAPNRGKPQDSTADSAALTDYR